MECPKCGSKMMVGTLDKNSPSKDQSPLLTKKKIEYNGALCPVCGYVITIEIEKTKYKKN